MKNSLSLLAGLGFVGIVSGVFCFNSLTENVDQGPKYESRSAKSNYQAASDAASYYNLLRRNVNTGKVESSDLIKGREVVKAMAARKGGGLNLAWTEMGPDNVGGRTRAILVDQSQLNVVFAGGVSGGLWRSNDGGNLWHHITGFVDNLCVSSIAQTGNGFLYVATGNHHERPSASETSGFIGGGLFVSQDGGTSWSIVPGTEPAIKDIGADWTEINEVVADPLNPERVWIASNGPQGLYYYDPANGLASVGGFTNSVEDLKIEGSNGQTTMILGVVSTGIRTYVSHDMGVTFQDVSGLGASQIPVSGVSRIEYAISSYDPNWVYASAVSGTAGTLRGIYLSRNAGLDWEPISPSTTPAFDPFVHPASGNAQGFYDNAITVNPFNKEHIIVGGITLWDWKLTNSNPIAGQWEQIAVQGTNCSVCVHSDIHTFEWDANGWLYIGTDGGVYKTEDRQLYLSANRGYNVTQFYGIAISPNDKVIGGTQDNGMIYLHHQGNTWMEGTELPLSVGADGITAELSHYDPDVMFGTGQFGFLERSEDGGINWSSFYQGPIASAGTPLVNLGPFKTPIRLFENDFDTGSLDSLIFVADQDYAAGDTIFYSSSTGNRPLYYEVTSTVFEDDTVVLVDPVQSLLAVGFNGAQGVWITRDAMRFSTSTEWWNVMDGTSVSAFANDVVHVMEFSIDGDHLFIGTFDGDVYRVSGLNQAYSADVADIGGANFGLTTTKIQQGTGAVVTDISSDPQNVEHLVITLGGFGSSAHVLESQTAATASGAGSFASISGNFPDIPAYSCVIDRDNSDIIVVGTEYGVFGTDDGGSSWVPSNGGMENVPVFDMRQQYRTWDEGAFNPGVIYIGTHGRGIWKSETLLSAEDRDSEGSSNDESLTLEFYPNPVSSSTEVTFELAEQSEVNLSIYDLSGKLIQQKALGSCSSGVQSIEFHAAGLSEGVYLVNIETANSRSTGKMVVRR